MALPTHEDLICLYNQSMSKCEVFARQNRQGSVRVEKGKLVETLTENIVALAWMEARGKPERLSIGDQRQRTFRITLQPDYVSKLPLHVGRDVRKNESDYFIRAKVDKHIFVDGVFVMGIECKAFAENAMLKRILLDFRLLKSLHTKMICCLLQLESQLGGDYSRPLVNPRTGSRQSHTLMSFFPEVELNVVTLLEGERHPKRPIHKPEFRKELKPNALDHAICQFAALLRPFI